MRPQLRAPARTLILPQLPLQGFLVESRREVTFVSLDGSEIDRLSGFEVSGYGGASEAWLSRGRDYYRLDVERHRLIPVPKARAEHQMNDEGSTPELPTPEDQVVHCRTCPPEGMPVGYWRFALPSPEGSALLAQYSGECEVPITYWVEAGVPQEITATPPERGYPESEALGWSADGRALVYLGEGYCGGRGDPPGIYAFRGPGDAEFVYRTPPLVVIHMWGSV